MGTRTGGILVTHTDVDHIGGVAALADGTGAEVWAPAGEVEALRTGETRGGMRVAAARSGAHRRRAATRSPSPASTSRSSTSRATPRATSRSSPTAQLFSGDLLFAGSVGRVDLAGGDWETLLASVRSLLERFPPETVDPSRATARRRRSAASCRRIRSCASCAPSRRRERQVPGAARDARRPARRRRRGGTSSARWRRSPRSTAGAASRRPGFEDTGALRAHVGRGVRRRAQGDVHVHRPQRPLADAAARKAPRRSRAPTSSTACTASRSR